MEARIKPYLSYSQYLKKLYGETTYRVGIDAGFSCPHRAGAQRYGGCTFCDEYGSRAAYQRGEIIAAPGAALEERIQSVKSQAKHGIAFLKERYGTESFILYFQAFSSTYGPPEELERIYEAGLSVYPFRELVVSTRPDCVNGAVADLLGSYVRRGLPVWVELGLQSASDSTLKRIHRGHAAADFDRALGELRRRDIRVAAHVILGLPGEGRDEVLFTVDYLAAREIDGIKFHDLHIPRNCALFSEYLGGELALACEARYLGYVVEAIERLPEHTVIMRLTCDTPDSTRALPLNPPSKARFVNGVREELARRGSGQGSRRASASRTSICRGSAGGDR